MTTTMMTRTEIAATPDYRGRCPSILRAAVDRDELFLATNARGQRAIVSGHDANEALALIAARIPGAPETDGEATGANDALRADWLRGRGWSIARVVLAR